MATNQTPLQKSADEHEKKGYDAIALEVMSWFDIMRNHRTSLGLDQLIAECDNRYNGKYSDEELEGLEETAMRVKLGMTGMLTRTALTWLEGAFSNAMDRPWGIEPTPIPSLPPELKKRVDEAIVMHTTDMLTARQNGKMLNPEAEKNFVKQLKNTANTKAFELAREATNGMVKKIEDQLIESRWRDVFHDFLLDFVKYPFAVIKGPLYGPMVKHEWDGEDYVEKVVDGYYAESIDPSDIFWSPDSKTLKSGKAIIHRDTYSASDILALRDHEDVVKDHIKLVLGFSNPEASIEADQYKAERIGTTTDSTKQLYTVYNFYGLLTGTELLEFATLDELSDIDVNDFEDPDKEFETERFGKISPFKTYEVFAMVCRGYTLLVRIQQSLKQSRPFHSASSYPRDKGIVGSCVPLIVSDLEDGLNANFSGSMYNMYMSSGPIIEVSAESFVGKEAPDVIKPWSVHTVSRSRMASNNNTQAITYRTIPSNLQSNLAFENNLWDKAHNVSGLPRTMYGEGQGSPRTLGAFSLLYASATKTIKMMIAEIDHDVMEPFIEQMYHMIMLYDEDKSIKADARVRVRGSQGIIAAEQKQARPLELAQALAPLLAQLGPEKATPIVEKFLKEALTEHGYDPADMGQPNEALVGQEAQNRALQPEQPLDGRSQAAINVMGGAQIPNPS